MRRFFQGAAALSVLLVALPLRAQAPAPARISVDQVWNSLPDFVCKEKIVSARTEKGKNKEQKAIESVFMAQRKTETRADGQPIYSLLESREITAIDGKAAPKDARMPTSPLFFDGLAANILFIADGRRYAMGNAGSAEGRLSVRIGFTNRNAKEFLQLQFPAAVGSVQIDTSSSKILHVESRLASMRGGTGIPVAADFQSIQIDGKSYWLPWVVKADATLGKDENAHYTAEYSDCKKFEVSVQIRPVQ